MTLFVWLFRDKLSFLHLLLRNPRCLVPLAGNERENIRKIFHQNISNNLLMKVEYEI